MTLSNLPDAELVRRMRGGDEAAWGVFVERYSRYVHAIATRAYRLREHDAEDVFQEVFARAYSNLGSLRTTRRSALDGPADPSPVHRPVAVGGREEPEADIELAAQETIERIEEACAVQDALATLSPGAARCRPLLLPRRVLPSDRRCARHPNGTIATASRAVSRVCASAWRSVDGKKRHAPAVL
jgi:DNA-directed RNA polymerase specialized sigma24 family protein